MEINSNPDEHKEFETKYEVNGEVQHYFKQLVEKEAFKKFIYVQGTDTFYVVPGRTDYFARYRRPDNGSEAWFTIKKKKVEKNNIDRTETNWNVNGTSFEDIDAGAKLLGFERSKSLWKSAHIYQFEECTLVFYTVSPEEGKFDHFIEIEVREDKNFEEEKCWEIIRRNEDFLASLGINPQKRKRKSLPEMYVF